MTKVTVEIEERKNEVRLTVNSQDLETIERLALNFDIDIKKFKGLQNGLRKMNLVNSIIGAVSRELRAGTSFAEIKAIIKHPNVIPKHKAAPKKARKAKAAEKPEPKKRGRKPQQRKDLVTSDDTVNS